MDRRTFMRSSAVVASTAAAASQALAAQNAKPRRVGLIGAGWYGKCDTLQLLNVEPVEIVSVSDVDSNMLDDAADLFAERQVSKNRPKTYGDYRKQLAENSHDIVIIGTPDHWRALPMIAAVESGADVYVQKPTGVDTLESKAMLDAARRTGRVVQVGTQRRSTPHLLEAKEKIVDAGLLGDVAFAEVCCYYHMRAKGNPPNTQPPENLNYEMWTGPAPMRPYNEWVHPRKWRAFMEYGNGIVGDMCVHMLDLVRWMLQLPHPRRVTSHGGILVDPDSKANITDTQTATFHFDDLNVCWTHRSWGSSPDPEYPWGATIYGDRGTLKLSVQQYEFIPQGRGETLRGDAVIELDKFPSDKRDQEDWRLELHVASAIRGHLRNFLNAIDNRSRPVADIAEGHASSAACILANLSQQVGRSLEWDAETHRIVGDPAANALLKRDYRQPWVHPADAT